MIAIAGTIVLALCSAAGGWLDVAQRRLPNWLSLATAVAGLAFVYAQIGLASVAWAAAHLFVALLAGMALFRLGWIGGGDAKFYAACAAWFPLKQALVLLLCVSLTGFLLVVVWFGYRQVARAKARRAQGEFAMVPYGLAIAVGALAARVLLR